MKDYKRRQRQEKNPSIVRRRKRELKHLRRKEPNRTFVYLGGIAYDITDPYNPTEAESALKLPKTGGVALGMKAAGGWPKRKPQTPDWNRAKGFESSSSMPRNSSRGGWWDELLWNF